MSSKFFQFFSGISLVAAMLFMVACDGDDEPVDLNAPTITIAESNVDQKPGETATLVLTYNAPGIINSLTVSIDNGATQDVQFTAGSKGESINITFDIPLEKDGGKSTWGTLYDFAFAITDQQQTPKSGTANVTVTARFTPANPVSLPATYNFSRGGETTVSFSGQTERLDQLSEMKALMGEANIGNSVSGQALLDMFANTNGNGGGNFSFESTKQLKNKTFISAVSNIESLLSEMGTNSQNPGAASAGTAGLLERTGNGKTILVDANGREYAQLIEKGLMGSVFLNQIYNTYLTDNRTGDDVQNISLRDGENYTDLEHHWDEAFGYFGVPIDFPATTTNRFWGNYSNGRDAILGSNQKLMDAYLKGRTAIVNYDYAEKNAQKDVLYENLELIAAATAIHYINATLDNVGTDQGELHHSLSEAWAFIESLLYSPKAKMTSAEINAILQTDIGENFYNVTVSGLNTAKDKISTVYDLDNVKNDL